jgi:hypothetical protein
MTSHPSSFCFYSDIKGKVDDILSDAKEMMESMQSKMMIDKYRSNRAEQKSLMSSTAMGHRSMRPGNQRSLATLSVRINKGLEHSHPVKDTRRIQNINDLVNADFRSLRKNLGTRSYGGRANR